MNRFRHYLLAFCMLWLPVQSFAANFTGVDCAQDVAEAFIHGGDGSEHDAHGIAADAGKSDGEDAGTTVAHDCCHHQVTLATLFVPAPELAPMTPSATVVVGWLSHLPEQLQRPPLFRAA